MIVENVKGQRRIVDAHIYLLWVTQREQMHDRCSGIIDVHAICPMPLLARRTRLSRTQTIDQLQLSRPIKAGQAQYYRFDRLIR